MSASVLLLLGLLTAVSADGIVYSDNSCKANELMEHTCIHVDVCYCINHKHTYCHMEGRGIGIKPRQDNHKPYPKMSYIVLLIVCASVAGVSADNVDCDRDQDNACRATCDDGTVLDISNLLSYPYKIIVDDSKYFTYSPCNGLECSGLSGITVCLNSQDNCGSTDFLMWTLTNTNPLTFTVEYSCGIGTECTSSTFKFIQNDDEETKVTYASLHDGAYQFQVTGKCVGQTDCVEEPSQPSDGHKKKSIVGPAGLVLMILFFAALLIYFIAGALVMKYHKGATGKELILNYLFWLELPFLVKDGCLFVVSPCRRRKGYEAL